MEVEKSGDKVSEKIVGDLSKRFLIAKLLKVSPELNNAIGEHIPWPGPKVSCEHLTQCKLCHLADVRTKIACEERLVENPMHLNHQVYVRGIVWETDAEFVESLAKVWATCRQGKLCQQKEDRHETAV
nr:hypothetical protein [uncultured Rhodopila sp.]